MTKGLFESGGVVAVVVVVVGRPAFSFVADFSEVLGQGIVLSRRWHGGTSVLFILRYEIATASACHLRFSIRGKNEGRCPQV
jgi:hypothetical protein